MMNTMYLLFSLCIYNSGDPTFVRGQCAAEPNSGLDVQVSEDFVVEGEIVATMFGNNVPPRVQQLLLEKYAQLTGMEP